MGRPVIDEKATHIKAHLLYHTLSKNLSRKIRRLYYVLTKICQFFKILVQITNDLAHYFNKSAKKAIVNLCSLLANLNKSLYI